MKKILIITLSLILIIGLVGCNKKEDEPIPTDPIPQEEEHAGGWQINSENSLTTMPQEAATAWTGAMEGMAGAGYEPVALIGTQLVAGTNYMFIARETLVTQNPVVKLAAVVVYADLEGNSSITSVKELDLESLTSKENSGAAPETGLAGGWTVFEDMDKMADVSSEDTDTFNKALEGLTGVGYTPVTVLGTQVVAGENLAYLAKGTMVTANPVANAYVISVYKDLEGNASVNNICVLNLADLKE